MKEEIRDMEDKVRSSIIYLVGVPEEDNGKNCKEFSIWKDNSWGFAGILVKYLPLNQKCTLSKR